MSSLRVLLLSPLPGLDPPNGDVTYTEELLHSPPRDVEYTTYESALAEGHIRELYGRPARRNPLPARELLATAREGVVNRARRHGLLFRERFRHFDVQAGAFDVVHSHVFAVALHGAQLPLVISNSIDIAAVYRDAFREPPRRVAVKAGVDRRLARATGVTHASFPGSGPAAVVALSDYLADRFRAEGVPPGSVFVVPPAVTVPDAARSDPPGPFTLGFTGHWRAKGGPTVLDAHRRLRSEGRPCELLVVGTTPQLGVAESEALGVHWLPRLSRDELLADVIPRFSAFAYPTHFDGLPMTLLEVMARGVPVVVSDYRALPEVVDYGRAGTVVPEGDSGRLADAIRALMDPDARARWGQLARWRIESRYTGSVTAPMLGNVYRAVHRSSMHTRPPISER